MKKVFAILLGIFWISPFVLMVFIALNSTGSTAFSDLFNPALWSFESFVRTWNQADFALSFLNSLIVTSVSVVLILLITSMAGYALARLQFRQKKVFIALMTSVMLVPAVVFSIPVYQILKMMHLDGSLIGLILAEVCSAHVMFVLLFMHYYQSIPDALIEAAKLDGASPAAIYWKIMFPLARPVIGTVVVTQTVWTWNSFLMPLILTLNNPELQTLSVAVYAFQGENIVDYAGMMAAGCITVLPMILLFILFRKYFIQGMEGAVKE